MSPSAKKQFNTTVGGLFIGLGILAWGVAAYFAIVPSDQKRLPPVVLAPSVTTSSCRTAVNALYQFTTRENAGTLIVSTQDISNPQKALADATSAIHLCKRELVDFCMGTGCLEPGLTMTLGMPENQRRVPASVSTTPTAVDTKTAEKKS